MHTPRRFDSSCRPYLCNLAVLPAYRGQGLGRALARHAERVVGEFWQEKVIYLHLDEVRARRPLFVFSYGVVWAFMSNRRIFYFNHPLDRLSVCNRSRTPPPPRCGPPWATPACLAPAPPGGTRWVDE